MKTDFYRDLPEEKDGKKLYFCDVKYSYKGVVAVYADTAKEARGKVRHGLRADGAPVFDAIDEDVADWEISTNPEARTW